MSNLPPYHVWCQKIIRIEFRDRNMDTMSINKYALYNSISRHILKQDKINEVSSYIYLYPHHYPIALLRWMDETQSSVSFVKALTSE